MSDTDRLAALLCEVFPAANRNQWPFTAMDVAASLIAAGVTLARPDTAALDVERLVAAVHNWHNPSAREFGSVCNPDGHCRADAAAIAREYAAIDELEAGDDL